MYIINITKVVDFRHSSTSLYFANMEGRFPSWLNLILTNWLHQLSWSHWPGRQEFLWARCIVASRFLVDQIWLLIGGSWPRNTCHFANAKKDKKVTCVVYVLFLRSVFFNILDDLLQPSPQTKSAGEVGEGRASHNASPLWKTLKGTQSFNIVAKWQHHTLP